MSRLPPLEPASLAPDQRRVYDAIASVPRGALELGALIGYYIMIGMTLLAHEVALPPGMALLLK